MIKKAFWLSALLLPGILFAADFTGIHKTLPEKTLQINQIFLGYPVGDAYILRLPDNRVILLDSGDSESVEKHFMPAIEKAKIKEIDTVIITHFHSDHASGLLALLTDPGIKINQILFSSMDYEKIPGKFSREYFRRIMTIARKNRIPTRKLAVGDKLDFGCGVTAEVYGVALENSNDRNLNSHSLVFQLRYGKFTALFTGDCSLQEEPRIFAAGFPLKSDLLKMAHHSGVNSTSDKFLDAVDPKVAITCMPKWLSEDNRGKRVEGMLKKRNIPFFRSWEYPNAVIFTDGITFGLCNQ